MANINVNNYNNLKLLINKDEYWDFFVNKDSYVCNTFNVDDFNDKYLISYIDLCDNECFNDDGWIFSKSKYSWKDAISIGKTLENITYLGVDNGLFTFRKDRITNKDFLDIFQKNKFEIIEDDLRLKLHAVSGNTLQYDYPLHIEDCCVKLNGGFYQGFFKTKCDEYQVFPSNFSDGDTLNLEFVLKKCDFEKESEKTLNDKYPNNKGIFFYIGTRAENKWIYIYDKNDEDGLESCYELGLDDFVEDGEIDKKDYIIGNFYDLDAEFEEDPPMDIDNYLNFNYYNNELYAFDEYPLDEYLDAEPDRKPKMIDETEKHIHMSSWCCDGDDDDKKEYILTPYFVGCGCPIKYKKKEIQTESEEDEFLSGCLTFGEDDYISGWEDLKSIDEISDYAESELDITDFEYYTDNGFNMSDANIYYFYTDNKFMLFDRTKEGKNVNNWVEGTKVMYYGRNNHFKGNLFILMNRTKTGYTVSNIDELRNKNANYYNPYADLYDNALAFRITDEGEIGYRLLTKDCGIEDRNKTSIIEGYSFKNVIPNCEWVKINIRISFINGDKMKFMFYIKNKLVYVSKELPKINLRELNDLYEKQEGVPYNISIGGGTQGLSETIQYNYMLNPTRVYPLEENFGGSFIGYIKSFKTYNNCLIEPLIMKTI